MTYSIIYSCQFVFVSIIGVLVFNEKLENETILGSAIVIIAGLFTFWREYIKHQINEGIN